MSELEQEQEFLTVLVPCFNEKDNIVGTVEDILSYEDRLDLRLELILIDDGSTDSTLEHMQALAGTYDNVRVRKNPRNLGVGRSVMNAYEDIDDNSWVTVLPGDNEFHFASILGFLEQRHDCDVILGYLQNSVVRPLHRRLASQVFSTSVRTMYGLPYRYLNGMKMYRVTAFKGIEVLSSGHAYNAELLSKAILRNPFLRIKEAKYVARGRRGGQSKAFRPSSVMRAISELGRGRVSVNRYRRNTLKIRD